MTPKWRAAHRLGQMHAEHARADGGQTCTARTDVLDLLHRQRLVVAGQQADRLFGAYFPANPAEGTPGGVWLNADMSVPDQRHTAAHELGHHTFQHGVVFDQDIAAVSGNKPLSFDESCAEAFAAWVLMPYVVLDAALQKFSGDRSNPTPLEVYRMALALGTSYRGTARHLGVANLIGSQTSQALQRVLPARVKNMCDEPAAPARPSRANVWRLADFTEWGEVVVAEDDRLVLPGHAHEAAELLLSSGHAAELYFGETIVLSALESGSDEPVELRPDASGATLRFHVERPVPLPIPDVSQVDEAELDRILGS